MTAKAGKFPPLSFLKAQRLQNSKKRTDAVLYSRGVMRPSCQEIFAHLREGAGDLQEKAQATFKRRRRECRVPDAPAAPCAKCRKHTVVDHRFTGTTRHSLHDSSTVSFVISLVTGLVCHHRRAKNLPTQLDASVGASGPHDFAVRLSARSSKAHPRPPPPAPNVRDDRETPFSWARDDDTYADDLGRKGSRLFLRD